MIYLKQGDSRWAAITLGKSRSSLAAYGCTTTCISMILDYFGCYINPGKLAKILTYDLDGILTWSSVTKKTGIRFLWRYGFYDEAAALEASKNKNKAVMFRVWYTSKNGIGSQHWVVGVRKIPFMKTWVIVDPITGGLATTAKYGNFISGMSTFERK